MRWRTCLVGESPYFCKIWQKSKQLTRDEKFGDFWTPDNILESDTMKIIATLFGELTKAFQIIWLQTEILIYHLDQLQDNFQILICAQPSICCITSLHAMNVSVKIGSDIFKGCAWRLMFAVGCLWRKGHRGQGPGGRGSQAIWNLSTGARLPMWWL